MTFKQKVLYFFLGILILVLLALFDFYVVKYIVDLFSKEWLVHTIVFIVLVLLVNPFIALFILNKLPIKPKGLKVDKGLKEALKKETLN